MMYYMYALLLLSVYIGTVNGAASDTVFTQDERDAARAFIVTTLDELKVDNQQKIQKAVKDTNTATYFIWRRAFDALCDPAYNLTTWDEHDERQARITYHNVLATSHWASYIQHATSVEHWGPVYEYMRTENRRSLAYRLKVNFGIESPHNKERARKLDTILFLTTFLLNEQFKKFKKLRADVQRTREDAGMQPAREMQKVTLRRSPGVKPFSVINEERQKAHERTFTTPREREKHHQALRRVVPKPSSVRKQVQPYQVPRAYAVIPIKSSSSCSEEGLLATVTRRLSAAYVFVSKVTTDMG